MNDWGEGNLIFFSQKQVLKHFVNLVEKYNDYNSFRNSDIPTFAWISDIHRDFYEV